MIARSVDVGKNCINCKDRYVGCHGKCEKYLSAHAEWEREKEETRKRKSGDAIYWATHHANVVNNLKKGK